MPRAMCHEIARSMGRVMTKASDENVEEQHLLFAID